MRVRRVLISAVLVVMGFGIGVLFAALGTTDSPGPPDDPASESYALDDLYNRLTTGAPGSQTTFTEPATGPGTGTMHTLNDIMAAAPAQDNANGAAPEEVIEGKTFWGLRTDGSWGLRVGNKLDQRVVWDSTFLHPGDTDTLAATCPSGTAPVRTACGPMQGFIATSTIFHYHGTPVVCEIHNGLGSELAVFSLVVICE